MNAIFIFSFCLTVGMSIFLIDNIYHRKECKEISNFIRTDDFFLIKKHLKKFKPKPLDLILGPFQFVANWLIIVSVIGLSYHLNNILFDFLTIWVICSRLRSLEELGHMAIHGAIGGPKQFQMFIANYLYQFPALKSTAEDRQYRHCSLHHPNVNLKDKDPGIQDFLDIGFVPGISRRKFWYGVFYPITPHGIISRIKSIILYFRG